MEDFIAFLKEHQMSTASPSLADASLTDYANHAFMRGEERSDVLKVFAAFAYENPDYSRQVSSRLPRFASSHSSPDACTSS